MGRPLHQRIIVLGGFPQDGFGIYFPQVPKGHGRGQPQVAVTVVEQVGQNGKSGVWGMAGSWSGRNRRRRNVRLCPEPRC